MMCPYDSQLLPLIVLKICLDKAFAIFASQADNSLTLIFTKGLMKVSESGHLASEDCHLLNVAEH